MNSSVTICIPTLNGMESLPELIEGLQNQTYKNFTIMIVDSSSSDGTYQYALSLTNCTVFQIKQENFSHSRTRQWMAENSESDLIVFLTQDAVPNDRYWLAELVLGLKNPIVACCFSRHTTLNPVAKRRLDEHFDWLNRTINYPISIRRDISRWQNDKNYRRAAHFNSDNSSAYKRELLLQHPFPNVPYGEDQTWAELILRNGFAINFADKSIVNHWNEISYWEAKGRGRLEAETWIRHMGYEYEAIELKKSIAIAFNRLFSDLKMIFLTESQFPKLKLTIISVKMNLEVIGFWIGARQKRLKDK